MSPAAGAKGAAAGTRLIFVGDPMCSWCYGFAQELSLLAERHPDLPLVIRVGGVRAGETEPMSEEMKRLRLAHWHRVEKVSGLPFDREAFMRRQGYVYDTEPACRAMVVVRRVAPAAAPLAVFRAIQHAFYAEGRDPRDGAMLADVVTAELARQGLPVAPGQFLAAWRDMGAVAATAAEFREVRRWGIQSFPALLLEQDGQLSLLAPGYMSADELDARLAAAMPARAS
ncbi:MAG TPA: DsbA family protein [Roseateles sp.]|nr:DsbA family protein [Roseateles sp.]